MTYDAQTNTLRVNFGSGLVYHYKDVPPAIYDAMKHAGAKGICFKLLINGRYDFEKVN